MALAGLAVHIGRTHPAGHGLRRVHQVDAHAVVLGEHTGPVVPVGERVRSLHRGGHDVLQAERPQVGQGLPFGRRDVGGADEHRRIPDVVVGRRHVEIAARGQRRLVAELRGERGPQRREPVELVGVVGGFRRAPVRRVQRPDPAPAAVRADGPGLRLARTRLVDQGEPGRLARIARFTGETQAHLVKADPRQQRHAVPPAVAVRRGLVTELADLGRREQGGRALGLLQANDVGFGLGQPLKQPGQPGLNRVHVPCRQAHAYSLP